MESDARHIFQAAVGIPIELEILSRGTWTAGHTLVADRFPRSRVLRGGDAVHLFTPAEASVTTPPSTTRQYRLEARSRVERGRGMRLSWSCTRRSDGRSPCATPVSRAGSWTPFGCSRLLLRSRMTRRRAPRRCPDQIVAWRGSAPCGALRVIARATGQWAAPRLSGNIRALA